MKKRNLILVMIAAYALVMTTSVSAVEYKVFKNHQTTMICSRMEQIGTTLKQWTISLQNTNRNTQRLFSTLEGNHLQEKISSLTTTLRKPLFRPSSIGLIVQLIIVLIATIILLIFIIGTTLVLLLSSVFTILTVTLLLFAIILIKIISTPH